LNNQRISLGGWPTDAFNYIQKNGIVSNTYPFINKDSNCQKFRHKHILNPRPFVKITEEQLDGNEELLKRIVHSKGPVVVAIHITVELMLYSGGVYVDDTCNKVDVNHAVVICGYGDDPDRGPYWTIRNSWVRVDEFRNFVLRVSRNISSRVLTGVNLDT
jgi:C1A family cysteine protease